MKHLLVLFLPFFLIVSGCSKKEVVAQSLIEGTWAKESFEIKTNGIWSPEGRTCPLDDIEMFKPDGTWILFDGTDQCIPGSGEVDGSWQLTENNTRLIETHAGSNEEYAFTVLNLDESKLVLLFENGDEVNTQYRITYTRK